MERRKLLIMSKGRHELILIASALIILGALFAYTSFNSPDLYASSVQTDRQLYVITSSTSTSVHGEVFNEYDVDAEYPSKDYSLVNINTDNIEKLCTLSGIGEAKAKAIIEYRNENGRFYSVYDLEKVSGISRKTIEDNIDRLTL